MIQPRLLSCFALAALAWAAPLGTEVFAQGSSGLFGLDYSQTQGPALWLDADDQVGRMDWGDVTGDLLVDAVALVNDAPFFFYGVEAYLGFIPISDPTEPVAESYDIAIAKASAAGVRDDVVVASARGIERYRLDSANVWRLTLLAAHSTWEGSRHIATADMDGDADVDAVFVGPSGLKVGVVHDVTATTPGSPATLFQTTAVIHDFLPCDFDGDGITDIALVTADAIEVRAADGTLMFSFADPSFTEAEDRLLRFRQTGVAGDRLAVVHHVGLAPYLCVFDAQKIEVPVQISDDPMSDVGVGDFNQDGADDVFVTFQGEQTSRLFYNTQGASQTFAAFASFDVPFAGDPPATLADRRVSVCDMDNDGDLDLLVGREGDADLARLTNRTILAADLEPEVLSVSYTLHGTQLNVLYQKPAALGSGFDEFELLGWHVLSSGHVSLSPIIAELIPAPGATFEVAMPDFAALAQQVEGQVFLVQRFVRREEGIVVESSPVFVIQVIYGGSGSGGTTGVLDIPELPCFDEPEIPAAPDLDP